MCKWCEHRAAPSHPAPGARLGADPERPGVSVSEEAGNPGFYEKSNFKMLISLQKQMLQGLQANAGSRAPGAVSPAPGVAPEAGHSGVALGRSLQLCRR